MMISNDKKSPRSNKFNNDTDSNTFSIVTSLLNSL